MIFRTNSKKMQKNKKAKEAFDRLPPSRQKEIIRYLSSLKSKEALQQIIIKLNHFLTDKKTKGVLLSKILRSYKY